MKKHGLSLGRGIIPRPIDPSQKPRDALIKAWSPTDSPFMFHFPSASPVRMSNGVEKLRDKYLARLQKELAERKKASGPPLPPHSLSEQFGASTRRSCVACVATRTPSQNPWGGQAHVPNPTRPDPPQSPIRTRAHTHC